jgi:hypothetical protein
VNDTINTSLKIKVTSNNSITLLRQQYNINIIWMFKTTPVG